MRVARSAIRICSSSGLPSSRQSELLSPQNFELCPRHRTPPSCAAAYDETSASSSGTDAGAGPTDQGGTGPDAGSWQDISAG